MLTPLEHLVESLCIAWVGSQRFVPCRFPRYLSTPSTRSTSDPSTSSRRRRDVVTGVWVASEQVSRSVAPDDKRYFREDGYPYRSSTYAVGRGPAIRVQRIKNESHDTNSRCEWPFRAPLDR
jgi:hypothetical protein